MEFDDELWYLDDTHLETTRLPNRRASNCTNEDDFDYALELRPDDEYRQAAESLSEITDDIEDGLEYNFELHSDFNNGKCNEGGDMSNPQASSTTIYPCFNDEEDDYMPFDTIEEGIEQEDNESDDEQMSLRRVHEQMQQELMEKQRLVTQNKLAMDRFLIAIASGVHIRRHQAHHLAETVRLYTNNGGHSIKWGPKVAVDLAAQKRQQWMHRSNSSIAGDLSVARTRNASGGALYAGVNDTNGFDCCFSVCGCGDDLLTGPANHGGYRHHHTNRQYPRQPHLVPLQAHHDDSLIGNSTNRQTSIFSFCNHNWGYDNRGIVLDMDILTIHPATAKDPTKSGFYATDCLRNSKDVFNPSYTFSVIYQKPNIATSLFNKLFGKGKEDKKDKSVSSNDTTSGAVDVESGTEGNVVATTPTVTSSEDLTTSGNVQESETDNQEEDLTTVVGTLDIECENETTYNLLFTGFKLLHQKCIDKKLAQAQAQQQQLSTPTQHRRRSSWATTPLQMYSSTSHQAVGIWANSDENNAVLLHPLSPTGNTEGRRSSVVNRRSSITERHDFRHHHRHNSISLSKRVSMNRDSIGGVHGKQHTHGHEGGGAHEVQQKKDPIKKLFDASFSIDPLRAIGVGGGLFPVTPKRSANPKTNNIMALKDSQSLPTSSFLGWNSAGTQIWSRLRLAGLIVKVVYSWDLRRIILKIKCPSSKLEEIAEKMHLRVRKKDGSLKVFKRSRRESFQPVIATTANDEQEDANFRHKSSISLFRSSERQQIIDFIIRSKINDGGAELDEDTELGAYIVQRFPLHMYSKLEEMRHSWVTFWKTGAPGEVALPWLIFSSGNYNSNFIPPARTDLMDTRGVYTPEHHHGNANGGEKSSHPTNYRGDGYFHDQTIHKLSFRHMMESATVSFEHFFTNLLVQPLDNIAEYYGEGVAFYFSYLAFYTRWLVIPAIVGLAVFCVQGSQNRLDTIYCIPYAVMIMIWASFMLVFWRQKSSALAYRWGVLEYEVEETERPQFRGEYTYDDATGEVHKVYPAWKRVLKYFFTFPLLIFTMCLMVMVMITVFTTQDRLFNQYMNNQPLTFNPADGISETIMTGGGTGGSNTTSVVVDSGGVNTGGNSTLIETLPSPWTLNWSQSVLRDSNFWTVAIFYPCLYVVLVEGMAAIVQKLAIKLNNFENHRTQTAYMNRLILKVFSFRFIVTNMPLIYYAVTMRDAEEAYVRMALMIFCQMTVGMWWSVFLDICVPALYQRLMLYHMKMNVAKANKKIYRAKEYRDRLFMESKARERETNGVNEDACDHRRSSSTFRSSIGSMMSFFSDDSKRRETFGTSTIDRRAKFLNQARSKCWEEALQPTYEVFSDYTNLVIQLGFVLLFAPVFPLAPLIALLNNLALIRLNAFKLTYTRQRPVAVKVNGIGVWEDILQLISIVGILCNLALFGLLSYQLSDALGGMGGSVAAALILFSFEHGILFFKYWLHTSVPRIPLSVQRAQHRERRSHSIDYNNKRQKLRDVADALKQSGKRNSTSGPSGSPPAGGNGQGLVVSNTECMAIDESDDGSSEEEFESCPSQSPPADDDGDGDMYGNTQGQQPVYPNYIPDRGYGDRRGSYGGTSAGDDYVEGYNQSQEAGLVEVCRGIIRGANDLLPHPYHQQQSQHQYQRHVTTKQAQPVSSLADLGLDGSDDCCDVGTLSSPPRPQHIHHHYHVGGGLPAAPPPTQSKWSFLAADDDEDEFQQRLVSSGVRESHTEANEYNETPVMSPKTSRHNSPKTSRHNSPKTSRHNSPAPQGQYSSNSRHGSPIRHGSPMVTMSSQQVISPQTQGQGQGHLTHRKIGTDKKKSATPLASVVMSSTTPNTSRVGYQQHHQPQTPVSRLKKAVGTSSTSMVSSISPKKASRQYMQSPQPHNENEVNYSAGGKDRMYGSNTTPKSYLRKQQRQTANPVEVKSIKHQRAVHYQEASEQIPQILQQSTPSIVRPSRYSPTPPAANPFSTFVDEDKDPMVRFQETSKQIPQVSQQSTPSRVRPSRYSPTPHAANPFSTFVDEDNR